MLNRILVAIILVPLTIYIFLYGDKSFLVYVMTVIGIGTYEIYRMMENKGIIVNKKLGVTFGCAIPLVLYSNLSKNQRALGENVDISMGILLLIIAIFILYSIRIYQNKVDGSASYISYTFLGIFYIGFLFSYVLPIKYMINGSKWLVTIQILVWISDTFAYLVGITFGRRFFSRGLCEISPKKSIEGSLGSIFFTILTMFLIKAFLFKKLNIYGIHLVLVPVLISIVGQVGDLAESIFKREFGVKDSGKLLGAHGGVFDRYDSLIWVFPMMFYYIIFFL